MESASLRRGKILLAEDDQSVLDALTMVLRQAGYDVLPARSGRDALRMLSAEVDLLISDLWMPQMDGLALLDEARRSVAASISSGRRSSWKNWEVNNATG